jgi:hypothetical protein
VIAEVFGNESDMVRQCKDLVFSTSPIRKKRLEGQQSFTPLHGTHETPSSKEKKSRSPKSKKSKKRIELSTIEEAHKE